MPFLVDLSFNALHQNAHSEMPFSEMPFQKCPLSGCSFCRTPTRSHHEVHIGNHPASKPGHLAQRLKPALLTGTCPQTQTFSESICQWLFKNWQRNTNTKNDYYKEEDNDNDKDKDAKAITGTLTVCYIFGILTTQAFQV